MGANPHANGGLLLRDLRMPDFRAYGVDVPAPGAVQAADTHVLGEFLRDVVKLNQDQRKKAIPELLKYADDPALDAQTHGWVYQALRDITAQNLPNEPAV